MGLSIKNKLFLIEATGWFADNKMPDKKQELAIACNEIVEGLELNKNRRELFAFLLFSFGMNHGPHSFGIVEDTIQELGLTDEFVEVATDFVIRGGTKQSNNSP